MPPGHTSLSYLPGTGAGVCWPLWSPSMIPALLGLTPLLSLPPVASATADPRPKNALSSAATLLE